MSRVRRALLSVSDKTGVVELALPFRHENFEALADQLPRFVTEDPRSCRIREEDRAFLVDDEDRDGRVHCQRAELLLALT